jgi:hypothetical protein
MASRIQIDIIGPLPNEVDLDDLVKILEDLRHAVTACLAVDSTPTDPATNSRISLVQIVEGSDGLVMEVQPRAADSLSRISQALRDRSFGHLPSGAHRALYNINQAASRRKWGIRIHENKSARIEFVEMATPDYVTPPSERRSISGGTSLLARCLRVGGATRPRAELRLSSHRLLHVEVTESAARELGKRLYDEVVLSGIAVWDAMDHDLIEFKVTDVNSFRAVPVQTGFNELANAAGSRWEDIDAESFVRELREPAD